MKKRTKKTAQKTNYDLTGFRIVSAKRSGDYGDNHGRIFTGSKITFTNDALIRLDSTLSGKEKKFLLVALTPETIFVAKRPKNFFDGFTVQKQNDTTSICVVNVAPLKKEEDMARGFFKLGEPFKRDELDAHNQPVEVEWFPLEISEK